MKFGCIGEKLGHSFSKEIHNLLGDYEYELKEIAPDNLDSFIKEKSFIGINVTIPYKEKVMPHLDFISEQAKEIGAVNTIVRKGDKLYGYNTDFFGLQALIIENDIDLSSKKVLILGTGGTSKTAKAVARALSAREIIVVSRTKKEDAVTYDEAYELHSDAEIIINTTPAGMYPNCDAMPIDIDKFSSLKGVVDVIYNPSNTCLINKAKERGIKFCSGLYMLVYQAAVASGLFFNTEISEDVIKSVYKSIAKSKQNIVLIGMPSCGKTSVGKKLAPLLKKTFVDIDEEIERRVGKSVKELFEENGEAYFRKLEFETIKHYSSLQGQVIATGGGSILNKENIVNLKRNGIIVYLQKDLDMLVSTDSRPLSSSKEALEKLYLERAPLYDLASDVSLYMDMSSDKAAYFLERIFGDEIYSD